MLLQMRERAQQLASDVSCKRRRTKAGDPRSLCVVVVRPTRRVVAWVLNRSKGERSMKRNAHEAREGGRVEVGGFKAGPESL